MAKGEQFFYSEIYSRDNGNTWASHNTSIWEDGSQHTYSFYSAMGQPDQFTRGQELGEFRRVMEATNYQLKAVNGFTE